MTVARMWCARLSVAGYRLSGGNTATHSRRFRSSEIYTFEAHRRSISILDALPGNADEERQNQALALVPGLVAGSSSTVSVVVR